MGFSCNFLEFAISQDSKGWSIDIFDKCSQPEYTDLKSTCVPHLDFNSLDSAIPLKFFLLNFLSSLYLLSSFFWWDFTFVASFPFSFCLLLCSSFSLGFSVFSSLSCFVQHTSIVAEFSHYCQSCDSNSLHWLMFDISPHPLLETDKVSGDVMVGG